MTEEQIEKKAKEWCKQNIECDGDCRWCPNERYKDYFIEGADWALSHQWVSVEDELPKDKLNVFIKLASGRSTSGWYSHSIEEWFISVGEICGDDCLYERVTHWMAIPPLAEEGGDR